MRLLLSAGCDAYAVNEMGFSALHIAALCGNENAVQELRMAGLEADGKDITGLTPEEVAETWGSHSTAWLLRKMPRSSGASRQIPPSSSTQNMVVCIIVNIIIIIIITNTIIINHYYFAVGEMILTSAFFQFCHLCLFYRFNIPVCSHYTV